MKGVPTSLSFFMTAREASRFSTTPVALMRHPDCPAPVFWIASTPGAAPRFLI